MTGLLFRAALAFMLVTVAVIALAEKPVDTAPSVYGPSGGPTRGDYSREAMLRRIYECPEERLAHLPGDILKGIQPGGQYQEAAKVLKAQRLTEEAVKWLGKHIADGPERQRDDCLALLASIYATATNAEVKTLVKEEYDNLYSRVASMADGPDRVVTWKVRESLWSTILWNLESAGHEDLLTPKFWSAVEAEEYRVGDVLFVHANPGVLQRLEQALTSVEQNAPMKDKVKQLRDRVRLVTEYPELKTIRAGLMLPVLDSLVQVGPNQRRPWLSLHMKDMRVAMDREKELLRGDISSAPATQPHAETGPAKNLRE